MNTKFNTKAGVLNYVYSVVKSANYTMTTVDEHVLVDTSATITFPAIADLIASGSSKKVFFVEVSGAETVATIACNVADTIDGELTSLTITGDGDFLVFSANVVSSTWDIVSVSPYLDKDFLQDNAITTGKIRDRAVTNAKLAAGAEIDTLTDGSDADALHIHAIADAHIADVATNPHAVTKALVGLGNVDNTSDATQLEAVQDDLGGTVGGDGFLQSSDEHLDITYNDAGDALTLTVNTVICYFPTGIEFGNTDQEYDVDGVTWINAVAGGALGGIPNEAIADHKLADCIAAVTTAIDTSYLAVREGTGAATATNPLTVQFLFTGIEAFDTLDLRMLYSGSVSHIIGIEFWNYNTSAWVRVDTVLSSANYHELSEKVFGASNFIGTGGDEGGVKLQIIHDNSGVASHRCEFDLVSICDGGGGGGAAPSVTTFTDNTFRILDEIDNTKKIAFQASDVTTGQERTITMADSDVDLGANAAGEIIITFYEGGATLTTGAKKAYISMPHAGTITEATLLADQSGSIVVDIWKDTYANFPPTNADSVTAAAPPTISGAIKSTDITLSGWTKTFSTGDIFEFNIDSVVTLTKCILILKYDKTGV